MKRILGLVVLSAALTGCALTIDSHRPVPDWPALKVVEHHVSHDEMYERCRRFVPAFSAPEGCTVFLFSQSEAHIYVSKEFPSSWALRHERLHAAGYDHVGSTAMQRMLENWESQHSPDALILPPAITLAGEAEGNKTLQLHPFRSRPSI